MVHNFSRWLLSGSYVFNQDKLCPFLFLLILLKKAFVNSNMQRMQPKSIEKDVSLLPNMVRVWLKELLHLIYICPFVFTLSSLFGGHSYYMNCNQNIKNIVFHTRRFLKTKIWVAFYQGFYLKCVHIFLMVLNALSE